MVEYNYQTTNHCMSLVFRSSLEVFEVCQPYRWVVLQGADFEDWRLGYEV